MRTKLPGLDQQMLRLLKQNLDAEVEAAKAAGVELTEVPATSNEPEAEAEAQPEPNADDATDGETPGSSLTKPVTSVAPMKPIIIFLTEVRALSAGANVKICMRLTRLALLNSLC